MNDMPFGKLIKEQLTYKIVEKLMFLSLVQIMNFVLVDAKLDKLNKKGVWSKYEDSLPQYQKINTITKHNRVVKIYKILYVSSGP